VGGIIDVILDINDPLHAPAWLVKAWDWWEFGRTIGDLPLHAEYDFKLEKGSG
jgi:hypothetical protein